MASSTLPPKSIHTPTLNRREVVISSMGAIVVGMIGEKVFAAENRRKPNSDVKRWPKPPPGKRSPRFKKKNNKANRLSTRLKPGFYINTRSKVVHYVTKQGTIRQVQRIVTKRLKPLTIDDVEKLLLSNTKPRVHLSTASRALEEAAMDHFKVSKNDTAFQLLATAIRHDQMLKKRSPARPSLRLYDLFAAKAVQLGDEKRLKELVDLAREADRATSQPFTSKVGRVRTIKARTPPSEFSRWQKMRKTTSKAAAIKTRQSTFKTRLKKWSAALVSTTAWERGWQSKGKTYKL